MSVYTCYLLPHPKPVLQRTLLPEISGQTPWPYSSIIYSTFEHVHITCSMVKVVIPIHHKLHYIPLDGCKISSHPNSDYYAGQGSFYGYFEGGE